jgi:hypothetical protein
MITTLWKDMLKQCSVFILLTKFLQKVKEKKKLEIKKNDF